MYGPYYNYDEIWNSARLHQADLMREAQTYRLLQNKPQRRLSTQEGLIWKMGEWLIRSGNWMKNQSVQVSECEPQNA